MSSIFDMSTKDISEMAKAKLKPAVESVIQDKSNAIMTRLCALFNDAKGRVSYNIEHAEESQSNMIQLIHDHTHLEVKYNREGDSVKAKVAWVCDDGFVPDEYGMKVLSICLQDTFVKMKYDAY